MHQTWQQNRQTGCRPQLAGFINPHQNLFARCPAHLSLEKWRELRQLRELRLGGSSKRQSAVVHAQCERLGLISTVAGKVFLVAIFSIPVQVLHYLGWLDAVKVLRLEIPETARHWARGMVTTRSMSKGGRHRNHSFERRFRFDDGLEASASFTR